MHGIVVVRLRPSASGGPECCSQFSCNHTLMSAALRGIRVALEHAEHHHSGRRKPVSRWLNITPVELMVRWEWGYVQLDAHVSQPLRTVALRHGDGSSQHL